MMSPPLHQELEGAPGLLPELPSQTVLGKRRGHGLVPYRLHDIRQVPIPLEPVRVGEDRPPLILGRRDGPQVPEPLLVHHASTSSRNRMSLTKRGRLVRRRASM